MNILFILKVKILVLMKWSYRFPPVMLTMEPRLIIIFWAHNPTSSKYISPFWYLFLESHQITYHSNVGVLIRKVTNKGSFTLLLIFGRMKGDLKLLCYAQADEEGRSNADDFCTATGQQLEEEYTKDGTLDFRGRPARKSRTGSWKTSWFIYCKFFLQTEDMEFGTGLISLC